MNDGASTAIRTEGLAKRYRSGDVQLTVFESLSLSVAAGERVALVGESGAGKSTLLHLLGLLDSPSEGAIYLWSQQVSDLGEGALADIRNREIGFVWQMNTLLPEFSALENVMMPLLIRGVSRSSAADAARARLTEVGLSQRTNHLAGELSGGEQQRAVLARALVGNPRILLADEPTGNLDEATGARMMDLLEEVHETNHLTSVYVTHNPRFAERAGRILKLEAGALLSLRAAREART
jgi:lipoprotein-releasing system ATP-binding protein